jgi:hypothetical protein
MSEETVKKFLVLALGTRKLAAVLVLGNWTWKKREDDSLFCMDFVDQLQEDNFLNCVITGD